MAQLGHDVYATLANLGVPSFAFINGLALGGGLEIALQSTYRTVSTGAGALALPEAFIGLVPGWGGVYILPRLIGPENAVKVMIENPLSNNRTLTGPQAFELGMADAMFEPADFVEQSLAWAAQVIAGAVAPGARQRRRPLRPGGRRPLGRRRRRGPGLRGGQDLQRLPRTGQGPGRHGGQPHHDPGGVRGAGMRDPRRTSCRPTSSAPPSTPSWTSCSSRSKRPAGAPDRKLARPVTKIGVVGAGLMASQLALLFARQLKVPVVMTDIDQARVDKGVGYVHAEVDKLLAEGPDQPRRRQPDQGAGHRIGVQGGLRRRRLRHRGGLRGTQRQEAGLRGSRGDRFARVHPRHQHVVAVRHRHGRGPGAPGAAGRLPLLQPGGRDAAAGDRPRPEDRRRRAGHRVRARQGAQEVRRAGQGRRRVRGQPHPAAPHGRSDGRLRRGHPGRGGGQRAAARWACP